jgi:hypothetical protein
MEEESKTLNVYDKMSRMNGDALKDLEADKIFEYYNIYEVPDESGQLITAVASTAHNIVSTIHHAS